MVRLKIIVILLLLAGSTFAQDTADTSEVRQDSLRIPPDSLSRLVPADSIPADSLTIPDSLLSDTLSEVQKAMLRSEYRQRKLREMRARADTVKPLVVFDSLATYFLSERLNLRNELDESFYHDAGDYFKFNTGYVTIDRQVTPMRKTVRPFGLQGDRLNVLMSGRETHPFEHIVEPDGLIDMNDIPTAVDDEVYILPGAVGTIFGADKVVATLLRRPLQTDDHDAHSAFLVDKGFYGYSYARARYARNFADGRKIDFGLGYRNADGPFFSSFDDAYHYFGDFYIPVAGRTAVHAVGRLYNRDGSLRVRKDVGSVSGIIRDRFDRYLDVGLVRHSEDKSSDLQLRYRHERESSDQLGPYINKLNRTGHGVTLARDWVSGSTLIETRVDGDYLEYDNAQENFQRYSVNASFTLASMRPGWRYALRVKQGWVEDYDYIPTGALMLYRESEKSLVMLAAGFATRAPTLNELHLPLKSGSVYGISSLDYADRGNPLLKSEKQLTGTALVEYGPKSMRARLTLTGGRIFDGIDWKDVAGEVGAPSNTLYQPVNGDVDFFDVTFQPEIRIADLIRLNGGGSYHYVAYEQFPNRAYTPEYQFFGSSELHVYWKQRRVHLYAYGEATYVGPYHGLFGQQLGEDLIFNVKLSFTLGSFRFHYIIQNVLNTYYAEREDYLRSGRFASYGFVWNFLN